MQMIEMHVEETILSLLEEQGYELLSDNDAWVINRKLSDFINEELLLSQLKKMNKFVSEESLLEAINVIKRIDHPSLFERNKQFHKMLVDGITIEDLNSDINPLIKLIDYDDCNNNVFQVAHQIKCREYHDTRIPDILVFINGLPLVIMELKGFEDTLTDTDLEFAYKQLGANSEGSGYRYDIPTLFNYNAFEVISDGTTSKVGVLTSKIDRFNEWKSVNGEPGYDANYAFKINTLIEGLFNKEHIIDVIKNGIFFLNKGKQKPVKIMCQYHQYFGVIKSLKSVKNALKPNGDGKAGIVWHTQGSGKSFSMVMLAHRLITAKSLNSPTIVILTDRVDLDDQLYSTFAQSEEFLRTQPIRVESRKDLLKKFGTIKQGGVILTTIGKFDKDEMVPNNRSNIIVMADEAHRGHYGIYEKVTYEKNDKDEYEMVIKYGTEKYIRESLPNATFIGFTGTPITTEDKSTSDIYGDIIDTYDMSQSVNDGATVRIFYEGRLAKIWTDPNILLQIDEYYDELEESGKASKEAVDKSKRAMSSLKKILEDDDVIALLANDIVTHYEGRKDFLNGKAMIVVSTRQVAMKLYNKIVNDIRPEWKDIIVPIVTESNKDSEEMRKLFKDANYRKEMGEEFKKEDSKIKIAIVVDMWLTGFDVPDLDVMYLFKKMKDHNLMQAIARVNRVYPGKESGLIVDYIGLSKALDKALDQYTARDKEFNIKDIQDTAKRILLEKLSILNELFHGVDMAGFYSNDNPKRFKAIQNGAQHILSNEDKKNEYLSITTELKRAFIVSAGVLSKDERENVQYYLSVRSFILKLSAGHSQVSIAEMNQHVEELLADAIKGDEVKVLTKVGTNNEEVNIIDLLRSDKIEELRKKNPPHVFIKIVEKLLQVAIAESRKNNYFKSLEYSERLINILRKYHNREDDFDTTKTIIDIIAFAEDVVQDEDEAMEKGLTGRERAFYDALIRDKSAVVAMPDATLKLIAHELRDTVEAYATTDWSKKKDTRALMRKTIKRLLKKYNYPPEYTETAINDVIKQAEYMMSE